MAGEEREKIREHREQHRRAQDTRCADQNKYSWKVMQNWLQHRFTSKSLVRLKFISEEKRLSPMLTLLPDRDEGQKG